MMKVIEKLRGFDRVTVGENERVLVFEKGLISNVLSAGEHLLKTRGQKSDFEWFDITNPVFVSHVDRILFEKLPVIADQHFVEFRTSNEQVAVIERDGVIFAVMKPDERLIVWKDAGPWNAQTFNLEESLKVNSAMVRRLGQAGKAGFMTLQPIVEGQAGLLYVDGQLIETIGPGVHAFWSVGKMVQVKVIDLRWQSLDVTGQEVLTRDRVTIRVNLAAEYRVADAIAAVTETKDFADAFYRALQYAFRRTLGARTL